MKRYWATAICCFAFLGVAAMVGAYTNGLDFTGASGAPGETACGCHENLNTGSGSASITSPGGYVPGETIDITVSVQETGKVRWGFAITALDGSNQPVGQMIVTDAMRTLTVTEWSGRRYVKQTSTGTDDGTANGTSWDFQWMAPATNVGQVTFYMAGLASNSANGEEGDNTYTTTHLLLATEVEEIEVDELPGQIFLSQNYPNPFNPATTIEFSISESSEVYLAVFNVLGQTIKVLHRGTLSAGHCVTEWDGTGPEGNPVAGGVYYYRLEAADFSESKKMVLLK